MSDQPPQNIPQKPQPLPPAQRRHGGNAYEQLAARYLTSQGLVLVSSNYSCKLGEIDLIMQHGDTLVFVEVRYRLRNDYGGPILSINRHKQAKVLRTAQAYLKHHRLSHALPSRIDVVGISPHRGGYQFHWVRNAIQARW